MIGNEITNFSETTSVSTQIYRKKLCLVKTLTVIEGTENAQKALLEIQKLLFLKKSHPNIISVYNISVSRKKVTVNVHSTQSYKPLKAEVEAVQHEIIMPYLRRGTLETYLKALTEDPHLEGVAIEIFRQTLIGITFLHSQHMVHGSIKPDNILLDNDGTVKLIDFGDSATIDNSSVSSFDDFLFLRRPSIGSSLHLYNLFAAFEPGKIDETKIGLLSLFRQLFPNYNERPKQLEFYNLMFKFYHQRNPNSISLLLAHSFLNPQHRLGITLLFESPLVPTAVFFHPIKKELAKMYSSSAFDGSTKRKQLYVDLIALTRQTSPATGIPPDIHQRYAEMQLADFSRLTTQPLIARPPKGFHHLFVEFALNKSSNHFITTHKKRAADFWLYTQKYPNLLSLQQSVQAAKEVYELVKQDKDPTCPLYKTLEQHQESVLYQLWRQKWKIFRIYGEENPNSPRVYIALNLHHEHPKMIFLFVGATTLPYPLESWWTNDVSHQQSEIWSKVNFKRSPTEHSGLKSYAKNIKSEIRKLIFQNIPPQRLKNVDFELLGHSTGGVLAILTADFLKNLFPESRIHVIGFGTPNFMTLKECNTLNLAFPNDGNHTIFNLIALNDPALGIYGENLVQPDKNTVFIVPKDFSGSHFVNIHAASQGTTRANIRFHFPENYQKLVEDLYLEFCMKNINRLPSRL